jgi:ATP-dependent RNA helicase DDX52/ROK1
LLHDCVRI